MEKKTKRKRRLKKIWRRRIKCFDQEATFRTLVHLIETSVTKLSTEKHLHETTIARGNCQEVMIVHCAQVHCTTWDK